MLQIITFKGGVPPTNFMGSIGVGLSRAPKVYHLSCWVRWPALSGF